MLQYDTNEIDLLNKYYWLKWITDSFSRQTDVYHNNCDYL